MIISHEDLKRDYLLGKEDLLQGHEDTVIDKQIAIAEEIVKIDLNTTTLTVTEINKTLVAYYTLFSITTTAVTAKEGRNIYKELYDKLIDRLRVPAIGISLVDLEDLEEE